VGNKRRAYKVLVGRLEGKKPLARPRHTSPNNRTMDLQVGWGGMDWFNP